jgi:FixJ family two-component response regulator
MIAIIDDDVAVRQATKGLLKSLGHSTETFPSAVEFLNSERIKDTTCVITDVQMPGMSGAELQKRLIADGYRIPIIFMTGFPEKGIQERVMAAGASAYLVKPYREQQLIDCLASALKHASNVNQAQGH